MIFKTIVRSEHLNHHGCLFGGYMLLWIDEYAYIAAIDDYPATRFVTRAMDAAEFTQSVHDGALLSFSVIRQRIGKTSVTYQIDVTARDQLSESNYHVFNTRVTLCAIDEKGKKTNLPPLHS